MRLGIDLDGVVFDFDKEWTARWNTHMGHPSRRRKGALQQNVPQHWDELHVLSGHSSPEEFWNWWATSGGFDYMPVYLSALTGIEMLRTAGHRLVAVTNRSIKAYRGTLRDLVRNALIFDEIVFTRDKSEAECELYIEDAPQNLALLEGKVVRMDRPWNDPIYYTEFADMPSVTNLVEFAEHVEAVVVS